MRRTKHLEILGALAALLTSCSAPKTAAPEKPGTSLQLSYPVLLIGTDAPTLNVFETERQLTTTTKSSSLIYSVQQIVDSKGGLYAIKKAIPVGEVQGVWRDMGTSPYRVFLECKLLKRVDLEQTREMVLATVRSPRSELSRPPERLSMAVGHIRSYRTLDELIAGCRQTLDWTH